MAGITYTAAQSEASRLLARDISNILLYGGSRSGKTFLLTFYCALVAGAYPGIRIAVLRRYLKDVRESILEDTFPKVMTAGFGWPRDKFEASLNRSEMVCRYNGSEIWFGGLDDSDRVEKILGKEYGLIYFNEVSQIPWQSIQVARTRLAQKVETPDVRGATPWKARFLYDCNPPRKTHWVYRLFMEKQTMDKVTLANPSDYLAFKMNPADNAENISDTYLSILSELKGDHRERFLLGNFTDSNMNALWKQESMIDPYRATQAPEDMDRVVVGVDPAVTAKGDSDSTGIIVAGRKEGLDGHDHYYVLEDVTLSSSPALWAREAVAAYHRWKADRIVAETNQGGDLVEETIRHIDYSVPIKKVHASRGKIIRAEPIAALYEQGRVHHVGEFLELEDEMTSFTGDTGEDSPDRMDALVWALTELAESTEEGVFVGSFTF